jgi:hypothetical protein
MARRKQPQRRVGENEKRTILALERAVVSFPLHPAWKKRKETWINNRLIAHLKEKSAEVVNKQIASVKFAGETYRPECCLRGKSNAFHLLAVECKHLRGVYAKRLWKEGVSQALHYRSRYKAVFLVLYDYTKAGIYSLAFGRGNKHESRFRREMREELGVRIIVLRPAAR